MTRRTDNADPFREPNGPRLPRRASYEKVLANIDKWVNSRGLQKPTSPSDISPVLRDGHGASPRRSS